MIPSIRGWGSHNSSPKFSPPHTIRWAISIVLSRRNRSRNLSISNRSSEMREIACLCPPRRRWDTSSRSPTQGVVLSPPLAAKFWGVGGDRGGKAFLLTVHPWGGTPQVVAARMLHHLIGCAAPWTLLTWVAFPWSSISSLRNILDSPPVLAVPHQVARSRESPFLRGALPATCLDMVQRIWETDSSNCQCNPHSLWIKACIGNTTQMQHTPSIFMLAVQP